LTTRLRIASLTGPAPVHTRLTVAIEHPAWAATSRIVTPLSFIRLDHPVCVGNQLSIAHVWTSFETAE
jgi:hypothetical protein